MSKLIDLTNCRFGRLLVIERANNKKNTITRWLCRCDCGIEKSVRRDHLKSGHIQSCGCLNTENRLKHGHYGSCTYQTWESMKQRCGNPNHKQYKDYGGRKIIVCTRWINSFENFLEDMGERPAKNYSIDRIKNDQGYYKENCRWATRSEQQRNMRNNFLIQFDGKTLCPIEWSEKTGIHEKTIRARLRSGWSIEKTLTKPVERPRKINNV